MAFKSLLDLFTYFKDESTCIKHFEKVRWNGNPSCPHCNSLKPYKTNRGYKCSNSECYKKFTVKVGTVFENSKIPFRLWFAAIYLCTSHKKGISSVQLAIDLNVTQKTAWFMLHRIRKMLNSQAPKTIGDSDIVEIDETFIGGKEVNRHLKKKQFEASGYSRDGKKYNYKKVVIGMIERNGNVILKHIPDTRVKNIIPFIKTHVSSGRHIITDEYSGYNSLKKTYVHETVMHSACMYVDGNKYTNTIENFWSVLKRTLYGVYHQVSDKHLQKYLDECSAKFNARHMDLFDRFDLFLSKSEGSLLYKNLIAKN